ncbi:MAG: hypothetical protein WD118_09960 [Phycisphaeraceae bacterium]
MHARARVESVDAIRQFRAGLWQFAEDARNAMGDAQSDLNRTLQWLENEQGPWWKSQLQKRHDQVLEARRKLDEKRLYRAPDGGKASTVEEEAALKLAIRRRDEAEQKLLAVRQWRTRLNREAMQYQAVAQRLNQAVETGIPNAAAHLDRLMDAIEDYLNLKAPEHHAQPDVGDDASMARPAEESTDEISDAPVDDATESADQGAADDEPNADAAGSDEAARSRLEKGGSP